ncbi:MAG: hypothetical protein COT84_05220 [Chlamydiae bacterium CG10_big_fil_rev_8_21_14_0_10_35_9]|nr:MAG: hypothetical protein COT84_05220 [Chlamydiae bacterium CG10_big_fil_rev_8_21_14_0_10_35_9]
MLYNLGLGLFFICSLPKYFYQRIRFKKYKGTFLSRLGLIPELQKIPQNKKVAWVHAVSLGETKAGLNFLELFKKKHPEIFILFSTTTETGQKQAQKDKNIDLTIYLPLDFSWVMQKTLHRVKPSYVFFVETDFWYNFIKYAKPFAKVFAISAKLSERSTHRLKKVPFVTKKLFSGIDHVSAQNLEQKKHFLSIGIPEKKISIGGNLKYDQKKISVNIQDWKKKLNIQEEVVITIASTHANEEELLLNALKPLFPKVKILIAPRHPERFKLVKALIESYQSNNLILIDKMGVLPACFSISKLALMGGSFIPQIGGHNILEPCLYQTPVIFGPYMQSQKELVEIVNRYDLGKQTDLKNLLNDVRDVITKPYLPNPQFFKEVKGACEKTYAHLSELISPKSKTPLS